MPVAPSFDDLLAQYEAAALEVRPTLQFLEGDVTQAHQHGSGAMADALIRFTVQALKETFLDGAKGDKLTALCDDHLNIQRSLETTAQSIATLTRTGGGAGGTLATGFVVGTAFDPGGNTVLFTLDAPGVTFGAGDNGPHTVGITAQVAGRAGNVAANTITRLVDTPFSGLVTITNSVVAGGGNEQESDDELRVRGRNFWQTLRRGTLAAIEFGALRVARVRVARATEDPVSGIVTLVVTDSDGNSTAQMVADTVAEIENWRAASSIVQVSGGTQFLVNVIGQLIAKAGIDTSVLGPIAAQSIIGRMNKLRDGETLFLDTIKAAAIAVDPDALEALVLSTPLTDTVPAPGQVIRPGTVSIT